MAGPRILLVIGGGIAAYKSCELVRLIRKGGGEVTCVLTDGGSQFVTPMALAALSENAVHTSLWDPQNEAEIGHIQLSRSSDLVVVCPATANLLAKMTAGIADDLATTIILATDKPVMAVPAMNVRMWWNEATQRNVAWLRQAGDDVVDPDSGPMACGQFGGGRLPEPENIWLAIAARLGIDPGTSSEPSRPAAKAATYDDIYEDLEPEDVGKGGRLGGLFSSLISRTTTRRSAEEIEREYDEPAGPEAEEVADKEEWRPEPVGSGPLLAGKGRAHAAPPAGPAAINHTVSAGADKAATETAEGDFAAGMIEEAAEPLEGQVEFERDPEDRPLDGRHILVTAGPTYEPIDPVRYLANRSSGRQGFAIAAAAAAAGAKVTLVAGPVNLQTPHGVDRIDVESAREMADAVKRALPADAAVLVAAVADWRSKSVSSEKMKKRGAAPPALLLTENPDILATVGSGITRPRLLIGFAAETEDVVENARIKRKRKGADWIVANDVSGDVMGGEENTVHIVSESGVGNLKKMSKNAVARDLVERIATALGERTSDDG